MIQKIIKLKNFGIFYNFSWEEDLPKFKKFNLIYGWNRSGKTTLSRVFSACERKSISFEQYPKTGEFEIKTDNSSNIRNNNITICNLPVKVFNKDFIDDNISFIPSDHCNPIVYVGEEDIESKNKLETLKEEKIELGKNLETSQKNKKDKEDKRSELLISLGREIANALFNKAYNKTKVENKIKTIGIDNFGDKILSNNDKKKLQEITRSEAKEKQNDVFEYQNSFTFKGKAFENFNDVYLFTSQILEKKVVSKTLERLKNDNDLDNWVKQGFDLHKIKNENEKCLFCQKQLDADFLESLSKHFSKDYEDLQNDVTAFINALEKQKKIKIDVKNNDLYPDLKNNYQEQAKNLNEVSDALNKWIDTVIFKLQEKRKSPLSTITLPKEPEDLKTSYNNLIKKLKDIINDHNEKVNNHESEVEKVREKLELHLIAETINERNYKKIEEDYEEARKIENNANEAVKVNNEKIKILEQQTSNIGKAVQKINEHLEEFFGRKEIQLELDDNKKGYIIKRDGLPANNLSEGEKSAIAFSYFIIKAQESNFKIKEGIIFIDDPISSFDSNFIYHCFSVIKNHFNEVGQLFISTHNFELFCLVRDWFKCKKNSSNICEFHIIENYTDNNKRSAQIKKLENVLLNFKSEYHYLFSLLCRFAKKVQPEYDDFYIIGNIARRFLEIFASFKIPRAGDLKGKIDELIKDNNGKISSIEKDKVYKLIQEFSHSLDPTSAIEHKNKAEILTAVEILLKIVRMSDLKHFKILEDGLSL